MRNGSTMRNERTFAPNNCSPLARRPSPVVAPAGGQYLPATIALTNRVNGVPTIRRSGLQASPLPAPELSGTGRQGEET